MKTAFLSLWLLALAFHVNAADNLPAPPSAVKRPAATITSVTPAPDKLALIIRYEIEGRPYVERITFAQEIGDFQYCRWTDDSGIAIVARTGAAKSEQVSFSKDGQSVRVWDARTGAEAATEYFYATLELSGKPMDHNPARIPAPNVIYPVLGIGNTFGDSVVITAVRHHRNPGDSISGWVYIDNCPRPAGIVGFLTPFNVSAERPQPK